MNHAFARTVADGAIALLIAPVCAACHQPLDNPTHGAVCARCWSAIVRFTGVCCIRCGDALPSWRVLTPAQASCTRCRRAPSAIALAAAIGPYEGALRAIIQALKYDRRTSLARPLAMRMAAAGAHVTEGADAVVPVPLHRSRERRRGFNQARELAGYIGLPTLDALVRSRSTASQADLPAARRHANVRGAFLVSDSVAVRGLTLVIIDDVSTTGATLEACARPLLAAGAAAVRALTAAKTGVGRTP